jgi:hypothetical protein
VCDDRKKTHLILECADNEGRGAWVCEYGHFPMQT